MSRLYSAVRIALCAIAVLNLGPVLSQSDAMERGRQWLELGNFDRARSVWVPVILTVEFRIF